MPMTKFAEPSAEEWDAFVAGQARAHVLQLSAWGALKAAYGWRVARVGLTLDGQLVAGAQILFRSFPSRWLGGLAYLPMGPYVSAPQHWGPLWQLIDRRAQRQRAKFLKWEPGIFGPQDALPDFEALGFRKSPQTIQPPRTILIDISGDDEAILARMNQGTRRKIRQSQKKGLRYYEGTGADLPKFNAMMQTTAARNRFGVHEPAYYQKAFDLFARKDAVLIMAEHEGEPLAGIMVFAAGKNAWYLYGASSSAKRNLMATYGVQWQAIQWAKKRGCTSYDLWGVPDEEPDLLEAHFQERDEGLWGVYGFKRGWGGAVTRSAGSWDKVYDLLVYGPYFAVNKWRELQRGRTTSEH